MTETEQQQVPNGLDEVKEDVVDNVEESLKDLKLVDESSDNGTNEANEVQIDNNDKSNGKTPRKEHQSRAERLEKQIELDSRSIFVGNVTAEATADTLEDHFKECGDINRVTILYNKLTGAPKGYAYIEFEKVESVEKALELKDSELHGETISVAKKRTNVPGYNNKGYYPRKEWIYPGWQGNVVRQWYYPYSAPAYQSYNPKAVQMPQNAFYPQYQYIPHSDGSKMSYPRGNYRGDYRGSFRGNYNSRRGNYKGNNKSNHGTFNQSSKEANVENSEINSDVKSDRVEVESKE